MELVAGVSPIAAVAFSLVLVQVLPEFWIFAIQISAVMCVLALVYRGRLGFISRSMLPPMLLLIAYYMVGAVFELTLNSVKHLSALVAVVVIIVFYAEFGSSLMRRSIFRTIIIFESAALILIGLLGFNVKNFDLGSAMYGFFIIFYVSIYNSQFKERKLRLALLVVVVSGIGLLLGFRASIYLSVAVFVFYVIMNHVKFSYIRSRAMWVAYFLSMGFMFLIYLQADQYDSFRDLNTFVQEGTGRQLLSGRQNIWPEILSVANETPIWGAGTGVLPRDVILTELSAHNYYLQLYLQCGIVGISILAAILFAIRRQFDRSKWQDSRVNFAFSCFLCLLLHNMTEVALFQNALMVSIPAWVVVGLGLSQVGESCGDGPMSAV